MKYHFVRERIESGDVRMEYVRTEDQLADILTKPLKRDRVEKLRASILG